MQTKHQQGSVLLISLGLLIVLTLMTFTISNSVLIQEKITTGERDSALALQVAETALRDAEDQANTFTKAEYTVAGNQGLYNGMCDVTDANCYLNTLSEDNAFTDAYWGAANSRSATTAIPCAYGAACPVQSGGNGFYTPGRYKLILLDDDFDISVSGVNNTVTIDNQYQSRDAGSASTYYLYKVIATGQGVDARNRRVIISYFAAPVL